jgi:HEAT repeat protein
LRRGTAYQDVSRQDLVEWELEGDASAVLARLVVELAPAHRTTARLALRGALLVNAPGFSLDEVDAASALALALGRTGLWEVLRPLERLYEGGVPEVRAAVLDGVRRVFNPRSFDLVRRGLADPSPLVVDAALRALRQLGFRDGFDAPARIFREAADGRLPLAAREALADTGTVEAGLFLLDVVRQSPGSLRAAAENRLGVFPGDDLAPIVRQALEVEVGEPRAALERVLRDLSGR